MQPENRDYLTVEELKVIAEDRRHEDHLSNNRMTWMLASQSLLLTAFALLLQQHRWPALFVAIIGAVSCISYGYVLRVGVKALHGLEERTQEWINPAQALPQVLRVEKSTARLPWLFPWNLIPWLMVAVWFCLGIYLIVTWSAQ